MPVAWLKTDTLPKVLSFSRALATEPRQQEVEQPPVDVEIGGVAYRVEPSHRYALDGMVVSYRIHDGDHLLHRIWNDHLNVADLCVVWGDDAGGVDLHAFEFANGEFTCTFRTRSDKEWRAFRLDQISNNHLITADPALRAADRRHRGRRPDPLEGYLASYSNASGFHRGSAPRARTPATVRARRSTSQNSTLLDPAPRGWRKLQSAALWGMLLSGAAGCWASAKGWF